MKILNKNKNLGLVSIAMAIVFILISAVLMAISSSSTMMGIKIINNSKYNDIAFDAAKAGLNYALADLNENFFTYMGMTSINSSNSVTLGNNTSFTINYKNLSSGDNTLLLVTSTGTELNSNISKTMSQLFQFKSLLINSPETGAVTKGDVTLVNKSNINSTSTENTMWASGTFSANGPQAYTTNVDTYPFPSSDFHTTSSDVIEGDSSLGSLSDDEFVQNFFGTDLDSIKKIANKYYYNTTNTNYSSELNGQKGKIIYIEQASSVAELDQGITLGTPDEPVILIVEGQFKMSGFSKFYGLLFLTEKWVDKFDYGEINGTVIVNGDLKLKNVAEVNYSPDILDNISGKFGLYSKVPGSWKDF